MPKTISEVIAQALKDAGVKVLTCVPGSGANAVFGDFNRLCQVAHPISFNEETAYAIAHGAALNGTRSAAIMKSHGFIKAGNSVTDSLYCGVNAGFLTIVCSDNQGLQSDSILDIRTFLKGIEVPFEEADMNAIYQQIKHLIVESERWQLPMALVVESHSVAEITGDIAPSPLETAPLHYRRDIFHHILCPFFSSYQHQVLQSKLKKQDWRTIPRPENPRLPESLPDKWKPAVANYAALFEVFHSIRGPLVAGDTGISSLFGCEPYNSIDITTYMGGSLPLAIGGWLGGQREVWALSGDFAFIAAGHLGLLEALQRKIPLKVMILDNGKAETTGGQPVPENLLDIVLSGYQTYRRDIHNPQDKFEVEAVLKEARQAPELRVVVANYRSS
jgi:TPP-dependent indolepyruvate ferredoxin oxidoreductase alpha subunit